MKENILPEPHREGCVLLRAACVGKQETFAPEPGRGSLIFRCVVGCGYARYSVRGPVTAG